MTDDDLRARLEKALALAGTHTLEDVGAAVLDGRAQLWKTEDALLITEIEEYPRARHLRIWLAAGELDAVIEMWDDLAAWGRQHGCSKVVTLARKGWKASLNELGWADKGLIEFEREL